MRIPMSFAIITLAPALLIALGALAGGGWAWAAVAYMTVFAWAADKLVPATARSAAAAGDADRRDRGDRLLVVLAAVHGLLLALVVATLARGGLGPVSGAGLFLGAGLYFGQVSNATAHELIHRTDKPLFQLGKWIYISLLFGHHTSAHTKVHHRLAATAEDPATARRGESFYRFAPRAWREGFRKGYAMEREDIIRRGTGGATPYVTYVFGAALFLALAWAVFGWRGLLAYATLAAFAQVQLLLSDYVQHYGLLRATGADGKPEPVGPAHSWNAGAWFTGQVMLNGPHHSNHHTHPAIAYPDLALPDREAAPRLPASLPVMSALALFPAGWRRVMDPALDRWSAEAQP